MPRPPVTALILVLAAGLCPAQAPTGQAPKKEVAGAANSLLRKDLLQIKKQDPSPPTRNIFAPRAGSSRPADVAFPGSQVPTADLPTEDELDATDETAETPPDLTVDVRYIGFVESARRLVALILFEGEAVAVVEGDVVGEGIRIGKVTTRQVEVILPDSSTRTFPLEGE